MARLLVVRVQNYVRRRQNRKIHHTQHRLDVLFRLHGMHHQRIPTVLLYVTFITMKCKFYINFPDKIVTIPFCLA